MRSTYANAIDVEFDSSRPFGKELIEIGLTTVNLTTRQIVNSYSYPISYGCKCDNWVSPEIKELTGWDCVKLTKRGEPLQKIYDRLINKHGLYSRLCVTDSDDELHLFDITICNIPQLNVSTIYRLQTGKIKPGVSLNDLLKYYGLEFEGRPHSGKDDSRMIAKIFLKQFPSFSF
jgi:DNA polymerase III epsilon subunit-like protein